MMVFILVLLTAAQAFAGGSMFGAQPTLDPLQTGGVRSVGLGGAGLAIWDSLGMHADNAAQIGAITGTTLRAGIFTGLFSTTDDSETDTDSEFGWQPFRIYFKVHPRYKIALGIDPQRRVDVRTFGQDSLAFESDTGLVYQTYENRRRWQGSGTDFRLDNAFVVSSKLSLGATVGFTSDYLEVRSVLDFPTVTSGAGARDVEYSDRQRFSGFWGGLSFIAQPSQKISVGAFFKSQASGDWDYERSVNHGGLNQFNETSGDRPGSFGAGVSYQWSQVWAAYADFRQQSWSVKHYGPLFESTGLKAADATAMMLGVEKRGGTRITDEGFDRWDYRAGVAYRLQPWQVYDGTKSGDVTEKALSLGITLPMAQNAGKLNLALELGQRVPQELDITENFARFYMQVDMHERWFQRERRKLRD